MVAAFRRFDADQLEYLASGIDWELILGFPEIDWQPADPLMRESVEPRRGMSPVVEVALAPPTSTDPSDNPINGHEYWNIRGDSLQYACIFPLPSPRPCADDLGCDCSSRDIQDNKPTCNPPGGGAAGTTQYFAGARPGLRQLHVLRDVGSNATVASICPKQLSDPSLTSFGYRAAFDTVVNWLTPVVPFSRKCFEPRFPIDGDGQVACRVVQQLERWEDADCECRRPGSLPLSAEFRAAATPRFLCGAPGPPCSELCLCELEQLSGPDLEACRTDPLPGADLRGWCYLDAEQGVAPLDPVCPRDIRFLGYDLRQRMRVHLLCTYPRPTVEARSGAARGFGEPCTPRVEHDPSFSYFNIHDVSVDVGTSECRTNLCLVDHFAGRRSCPYGQAEEALTLAPDDPERCRTPDGDPVSSWVAPQSPDRREKDVVYCSCRCAGPAGTGPFCSCPDGYSCRPLIPEAAIQPGLEGSYCVRKGSEFDRMALSGDWCWVSAQNCGERNP